MCTLVCSRPCLVLLSAYVGAREKGLKSEASYPTSDLAIWHSWKWPSLTQMKMKIWNFNLICHASRYYQMRPRIRGLLPNLLPSHWAFQKVAYPNKNQNENLKGNMLYQAYTHYQMRPRIQPFGILESGLALHKITNKIWNATWYIKPNHTPTWGLVSEASYPTSSTRHSTFQKLANRYTNQNENLKFQHDISSLYTLPNVASNPTS